MSTKARVSIVMGSDSDLDVMREAAKALEDFGIEYEIDVTSAHRSPERAWRHKCGDSGSADSGALQRAPGQEARSAQREVGEQRG